MENKPKTSDVAKAASDKALKPIIDYCQSHRGSLTRLAEIMTRIAKGAVFHRQVIETWVHPDPSRRTQPLYGTALLLHKAYEKLKASNGK